MTGTVADVVVIGNGAVGCCTAAALARQAPDLSIVVVGPSDRAGSASAAAGAMLGCFGEVTRHTLASEPGRARFALQVAAHDRWRDELADLEDHAADEGPILLSSDTYVIHNSRGGAVDSANMRAVVAALNEHRRPYEEVDEVPGLDPTPDSRPLRSLRLLDEGAVHAGRLFQAQRRRLRRLGVTEIDGSVTRIVASAGRVTGVELADGSRIDVGQVVVAAGAFTTSLLAGLAGSDAVPPVLAGSGVALVAERVMGVGLSSPVRTVTRAGSCGLHAIPMGRGIEYLGATNVIFGEPEHRPHIGVCHFLSECAIEQIDRSIAYSRIDEVRVGNRPVSFDGFPLLGPGPVAGLWVVTGGYRDGLHCAPEVADRAALSVIGGVSRFPDLFRPCRPPIETMSVEDSIADFADQQVASTFETGARLSTFQHPAELEELYRTRAERLYEQLGTTVALHPDVITFLSTTRKSEDDVAAARAYLSGKTAA